MSSKAPLTEARASDESPVLYYEMAVAVFNDYRNTMMQNL